MPVIVPPGDYAEWLDPRNEDTDRLARLLGPSALPGLGARPVSARVNNARNQGPELIEPVDADGTGALD
jgi:putative SOS response-associated peptidase YedK